MTAAARAAGLLLLVLALLADAPSAAASPVPAPTTAATASADPIRARQWYLDTLGAPRAWTQTRGRGITVAVLDTGVAAANPDLAGSVLPGHDFVTGTAGPDNTGRHGTGMAALIAGHGHGPGDAQGVLGVAPQARILPVRVILDDGDHPAKTPKTPNAPANPLDPVSAGIRWAVDHGADVINLSLGDDGPGAHPDSGEDAAIRYALAHGVPVVSSAGNGGADADRTSYPAAYPGVIAVAAVTRAGARADFSTRRWYTTVAAPGLDVVVPAPDNRYYLAWGTSAAAALVSGTVALIRARHPRLTPAQIRTALEQSARAGPADGRPDGDIGAGTVSVPAALAAADRAARQRPQPAVPAPSPAPAGPSGDAAASAAPRAAGAHRGGTPAPAPYLAAAGAALLAAGEWLRRRRRRTAAPGPGGEPEPEAPPDNPADPVGSEV
ncbi:hypothetical protein BIV57_08325 [Mangrovactinospora gilvigrisea]|uniref:Peptidase S8/S53 domain-containing protein n=1 Tax=Mangrovactinospora gilvigrisea TaxID=1428644 RepID=A0A1J7BH00_9ACTN|nr:S8 family serine peptidase [Mangrovactinospora gilvigrisea]OIV37934.1 hypothetical protein BIV57_08325 [Mangrovactinospora gilvigrisea]